MAARKLAMALNDGNLRRLVYEALQESDFPENKLHFRTLLRGPGSDILTRMADVGQDDPATVLARLDSIVDLEFYMPVSAHKDRWKGHSDLIVATVLRDDGTIPDAFDLGGHRVAIMSADEPPETPALVICSG